MKLNDVERSAAENTGESVNTRSGSNFVWGDLGYLVPMRERAFQTMFEPPPGRLATNCAFDMRRCKIRDARQVASSMSLDETGFTLLDVASKVEDFYDEQEVIRVYYPEIEALALEVTGGARAVVFDHLLRQREQGRPSLTPPRRSMEIRCLVMLEGEK